MMLEVYTMKSLRSPAGGLPVVFHIQLVKQNHLTLGCFSSWNVYHLRCLEIRVQQSTSALTCPSIADIPVALMLCIV